MTLTADQIAKNTEKQRLCYIIMLNNGCISKKCCNCPLQWSKENEMCTKSN